jgi:phosphatidylethanolamine/phosphatidyl-N-methylethanolamine N-methyltransferase
VIELGAGTGNITQAILDRGVAPETLHSIEMNPDFCDRLRARFPRLNVHQMSAGDVGDLPVENAQAVISGLPLLSMPLALQHSILSGTFARVKPGGTYVQFTYGPKPPVARPVREDLGLTWRVSHKIWWNLHHDRHPHRIRQLRPARGARRQVLGRADAALDHELPHRLGKAARGHRARARRHQAGLRRGQQGQRQARRRSWPTRSSRPRARSSRASSTTTSRSWSGRPGPAPSRT